VIALNPEPGPWRNATKKLLDFTTQLSGPLIKDKLFFFVSAQRYQKDQDPIGPRTRLNEASDRLNLKLNWQPSPNDSVSGQLQYDNYNIIGRAGISSSPTPTRSPTGKTRPSTSGSPPGATCSAPAPSASSSTPAGGVTTT
jgi:hypothetical protein